MRLDWENKPGRDTEEEEELEEWNIGILVRWSTAHGTRKKRKNWKNGILEYWNIGKMVHGARDTVHGKKRKNWKNQKTEGRAGRMEYWKNGRMRRKNTRRQETEGKWSTASDGDATIHLIQRKSTSFILRRRSNQTHDDRR
jgi:hypothetical protein